MYNLVWDLSDLFKNNELFFKEIDLIRDSVNKIERYKEVELNDSILLELLQELCSIKERINNILVYGSLKYYKNIKDEECIELKDISEKLNTEVNLKLKFIDFKILEFGKDKIEEFILKNKQLETYRLYLDNLFRMKSHVQNDDINLVLKENVNSINEEIALYNKLLSSILYGSIEEDGENIEINSSNFAKFISSRDRNTRRQTYLAVNTAFKSKGSDFAYILDSIYKNRLKNSKLEKYNSVLERVLFEENISIDIIESLIKSVNNNLPLMQKYLKLKSDVLGIKDPHLYDFNVPLDSGLKIKYSIEEAISIIKESLKPLGEEYLKIVDLLLDGHIDAIPDEKKHQSITFSWNTYSFLNYRGSYVDIKNMIHEIGHIVNYYLSKQKQPFIYEDSTVFVGETSSIVNEILLNRYLYKNARSKEEKIFYLSKEIENYFTSVFKQTMYTEYENELYSAVERRDLTEDLLSSKYENLIKKYYGENIIYDDVSNIEWTRLGHLYRWSYYPYKYATGLLIASVVVDFLIDSNTLDKNQYIEFLSSGSNDYSLNLLKLLNIDLTNMDVINNGFNVLSKDIKELEKILK